MGSGSTPAWIARVSKSGMCLGYTHQGPEAGACVVCFRLCVLALGGRRQALKTLTAIRNPNLMAFDLGRGCEVTVFGAGLGVSSTSRQRWSTQDRTRRVHRN